MRRSRRFVAGGAVLFVVFAGLSQAGAAGPNLNEAPGAPTHATLLEGPGDDTVSAYSGELGISIPIGPAWELPGLQWGMSLNYSSKIWRLWTNQGGGTLNRKNPFGVGWLLTMGRVFQPCRDG